MHRASDLSNRDNPAGVALSNSSQPLDYFLGLKSLINAISSDCTLGAMGDALLGYVMPIMGMEDAMILLYSEDGNVVDTLSIPEHDRDNGAKNDVLSAPLQRTLANAVDERRTVTLRGKEELAAILPEFAACKRLADATVVAVPMWLENRIIGAIGLACLGTRDCSALDIAFLETVAAQCAQAMQWLKPVDPHRHDTEVAARQSTNVLLDSVMACTHETVLALDNDLNVLACNKTLEHRFQSAFGKRLTVGMNLLEALADVPDEQAEVGSLWRRALAGEAFTVIREFGRADLARHITETSYSCLRDETGAIIGALHVSRDVTARVHAEQEQARLAAILEMTSDLVATATPDGQILYGNQAFRDFLGVTVAEVPTLTVRDLHTPASWEKVQRELLPMTQATGKWSGECVYVSGQGKEVPVSLKVFVHKDAKGNDLYRSAIVRDISEQKATEEVLRRAQERLEEAQRVAQIGSWEFELATQQVIWSKELFRLAQCDPAQGAPGYEEQLASYLPEDAARLAAAVERAISDGVAFDLNLRRIVKDGTLTCIHAIGNPVVDEAGRVVRLVGTCMDITEREHLEAELRQVQKMDSIGRLAGGIAHDFNNLLAVIMGYAELVSESLPEKDSLQDSVDNIRNAATRAANLTQQLLTFAHKQAIAPKVLQPNEILIGMIRMLHPLIGEAIELNTFFDPEIGNIYMDANQLEQVIVNLVVNARDAMPEGGQLYLQTEPITLIEATLHERALIPAGRYVVMTISDTGVGMTAEVKERLFEPFFTTKPKGKGTGLGLATVYGIVKQNRGYVWVFSEPGRGATFKIYLPCVDGAIEARLVPIKHSTNREGTATILLAEDEPMLRELAAMSLRHKGYRVLAASNGVEALLLAEQHHGPIDLLLTDAIMPQMGGLELARKLHEVRPETAVLLVSGYSNEIFTGETLLPPGIALLQKPFATGDLLDKIRLLLAERAEH